MREQVDKIRVSAGEDLLAFIPHMVGYWPESSIVCIGMAGKKLRATMRLDLPPEPPPDALTGPDALSDPVALTESARATEHFATVAATQLASDSDADGCLIAIFGRSDWRGPGQCPQGNLYLVLRHAFEEVGLPVRDAWFVGPDHWRSLDCTDAACCPWPGKGNALIKASFVNAEFVFRGSVVGDSPKAQVAELIRVKDPDFAEQVVESSKEFHRPLGAGRVGADQLAIILGAWEFSLKCWPGTPDRTMTAFLLASLADGTVRDAAIVALATTPQGAFAGALGTGLLGPNTGDVAVPHNWYGGNQVAGCVVQIETLDDAQIAQAGRDFCGILVGEVNESRDGRTARGPDWSRLAVAESLLQFLASATDSADKAPVLCLLGWIQWCKGRGTWAGNYFMACQQFQPGYRLASMLEQLLSTGYIAPCAKDPRTAWRGVHPDGSPDADDEGDESRGTDARAA